MSSGIAHTGPLSCEFSSRSTEHGCGEWNRRRRLPYIGGTADFEGEFMAPVGVRGFAAVLVLAGMAVGAAHAQGGGAEVHANGGVTAGTVGLPVYPGARLYKDEKNDPQADIGLSFGDFHFRLLVAGYVVEATGAQILGFYRPALAKYGEVLECENGKPVGALKVTKSGLTCSDDEDSGGGVHGNVKAGERKLRAGVPGKYRMVALGDMVGKEQRFAVLLLELPKAK
jgi:hypothetical protein